MNVNKQIDEYLKIRRQALYDLEKSIEELYSLGLRFISPSDEGIPHISAAQDLLPRFEQTMEDFEWKAIYDGGTELDQFAGDTQNHFGHIDQKRLAKIMYISNFEIPMSGNVEKRAIITLDFKNGTYDFLNCGSMEVRGHLDKPNAEEKKLILFKRKRQDFTVGFVPKESSVGISPTGEQFIYTRYYLGYETSNKKVLICIYPNSNIEIENNA